MLNVVARWGRARMEKRQVFQCSDEEAVTRCALLVKNGGVVVFPTDTVYGIGCDPYNDSAVKRIFMIKGRDQEKPLPVLAYSVQSAERIVSLGRSGRILAERYWPGALTMVAPIIDRTISPEVMARCSSLAVRVPDNKCTLLLLRHCKYLVGTSANVSGKRGLKSAQEVLDSELKGYDALLNGGTAEKGVESTIVDVEGKPKILREGAIKSSEVIQLLGQI
jgi:L-threonylcarbamoyladenylate synthase